METYTQIKKCLVVGIIISILTPCLFSVTAQNNEKTLLPTSNGNWLYVGGSGPGNYTKIQDAIDNTSVGDTVFIYSGTYNETIVIKKNQLTLIGQNKESTIINLNPNYPIFQNTIININANTCSIENLQITLSNDSIIAHGILINSSYNTIKNNIITNCSAGIQLVEYSASNTIIHNHITNNSIGIDSSRSTYNNLSHNTLSQNTQYNIYFSEVSDHNKISFNTMDASALGMRIANSKYNTVDKNNFQNNQIGLYCCCYSRLNYFYDNNFFTNTINGKNDYGLNNIWYDNSNGTGNYWDDYTGIDANGDGIGDTPYKIFNGDQQDLYPLMHPFEMYSILNISLENHEINEKASFKVTVKTLGETIVANAQVLVNNQTTLTDSNGNAQITAPSVEEDQTFLIVATKPGYISDVDTILVKNIPNSPPNSPTIIGETNGSKQTTYDYKIQTTDPNQDDVQYHIEWGDNTTTITGFNRSGKEINVSHTWETKGTYAIKVKAIDVFYAESDWATLTVTMPYPYKIQVLHFWEKLFQRFPHIFPLLRHVSGF